MHLSPRPPQDDEFYMQISSQDSNDTAAPAAAAEALDGSGPYYDPMDDIFGSDPGDGGYHADGGNATTTTTTSADEHDPATADLRRLRAQHNKEGYREGIMVGKAGSIQAGFDEGYSIGANVGLKAGQLLGLLEGIAAALGSSFASLSSVSASAGQEQGEARQVKDKDDAAAVATQMYASAKAELGAVEKIFGETYWEPDGRWKYSVPAPPPPPRLSSTGVSEADDGEGAGAADKSMMPSAEDVANAHPLIAKWTAIVDEVVARWGLDLELSSLKGTDSGIQDDTSTGSPKQPIKLEQQSRQAMDW